MAAESSKVMVELMKMKKFKKDTGYEAAMKKLYEQVRKGKAKTLTANIQTAKTTFTPGKGKPPIPAMLNSKVKQVKKGPAKDKVIVAAIDGDAKKKTYIVALRFATEENAKLFYDTTKAKGVVPPEPGQSSAPEAPAPEPPASATPPPPPPPASSQTDEPSRTTSLTPITMDRVSTPVRSSHHVPTRSVTLDSITRNNSNSSSVSRPTINDMSARRAEPPSVARSPSISYQSKSNPLTHTTPVTRVSMSLSSSPSLSEREASKSASKISSLDPALESRTTFISTDPSNYRRNRQRNSSRGQINGDKTSSKANESEYKHYRPNSSRRSAGSVRIFQLTPGNSPGRGESGRMYYYASNARGHSSSSSSSSSLSSSSSSESIATKWLSDRPVGRRQSYGRMSNYATRNRSRLTELTPRAYSIGPGSRRRNFSSSSSSSSSSRLQGGVLRQHLCPPPVHHRLNQTNTIPVENTDPIADMLPAASICDKCRWNLVTLSPFRFLPNDTVLALVFSRVSFKINPQMSDSTF
uniref:Expressed conserved protein n=1 Tax=Echinococcus granulosus TaxID=6210 RepID=A0A068W7E1_ECHGR|nr:expressed conserved protein [Echinococcus granulosus]